MPRSCARTICVISCPCVGAQISQPAAVTEAVQFIGSMAAWARNGDAFVYFISGAKVLAPYPMGPVAGTAWNITLMTYNGVLFMGVHIDPVAVTDPELLRQCLEDGFEELLFAGGAGGAGAGGAAGGAA